MMAGEQPENVGSVCRPLQLCALRNTNRSPETCTAERQPDRTKVYKNQLSFLSFSYSIFPLPPFFLLPSSLMVSLQFGSRGKSSIQRKGKKRKKEKRVPFYYYSMYSNYYSTHFDLLKKESVHGTRENRTDFGSLVCRQSVCTVQYSTVVQLLESKGLGG